ncbi:hypothetical protein FA95DRAFT_753524 [Auriscalpium vulgare]|uniref:Uncharacterized protein n=1 Tax=Auriscalpium vulgare TaxID=40419 RepID=A0ACB8SAH5_9AGAM|nr:hypothetical protein FA95DRAFT_753524 [Auriscalpium vulgare]
MVAPNHRGFPSQREWHDRRALTRRLTSTKTHHRHHAALIPPRHSLYQLLNRPERQRAEMHCRGFTSIITVVSVAMQLSLTYASPMALAKDKVPYSRQVACWLKRGNYQGRDEAGVYGPETNCSKMRYADGLH